MDIMKGINEMKINYNKIDKWNDVNISIFKTLENILESQLSLEEKEISVEKAIFEYDNTFFRHYFNNVENEIKIFTQEYSNTSKNYDNLIKDYTHNRSYKLKKLFKEDINSAIIIFMMIAMGKDMTISV